MAVKNEWSLDGGMITFDATVGRPVHQRDPVCGIEVPVTVGEVAIFAGEQYRFCSPSCRDEFMKDPERYTTPAAKANKEPSR